MTIKVATAKEMREWAAAHPKRWAGIHGKAQAKYRVTPRGRYTQHKYGAKQRGIEFLLTFAEWWQLWEPFWKKRGARKSGYVMARYGDKGPYAINNVSIITHPQNAADAWRYRR